MDVGHICRAADRRRSDFDEVYVDSDGGATRSLHRAHRVPPRSDGDVAVALRRAQDNPADCSDPG